MPQQDRLATGDSPRSSFSRPTCLSSRFRHLPTRLSAFSPMAYGIPSLKPNDAGGARRKVTCSISRCFPFRAISLHHLSNTSLSSLRNVQMFPLRHSPLNASNLHLLAHLSLPEQPPLRPGQCQPRKNIPSLVHSRSRIFADTQLQASLSGTFPESFQKESLSKDCHLSVYA
jgi:hypothetical protein